MTTNTTEIKRTRDYKRETALRKKRTKRLMADIEREKAERLLDYLNENNITLVSWMKSQIDKTLNA